MRRQTPNSTIFSLKVRLFLHSESSVTGSISTQQPNDVFRNGKQHIRLSLGSTTTAAQGIRDTDVRVRVTVTCLESLVFFLSLLFQLSTNYYYNYYSSKLLVHVQKWITHLQSRGQSTGTTATSIFYHYRDRGLRRAPGHSFCLP